ncbi:CheY-like superfamily [Chytridium lagenaria]|nr:CheY-like superfamily [Chytridium lagenaria]
MGGTIEVLNRRGGGDGSTFVVKVPLVMVGMGREGKERECTTVGDQTRKKVNEGFHPETPWLTASANREPVLPSPKDSPKAVSATPEIPLPLKNHALPTSSAVVNDVTPWDLPNTSSKLKPNSLASARTMPVPLLRPTIPPTPPLPTPPDDDRSILIVDDSSINRKILERLLRRAGVTRPIEECTNGLEAVEKVRQRPTGFTGIFMDLQMPVMDGTEATRAIRESEGRMPIVAVTASFVKEEVLKREFGFTALAPKPFLKADAEKMLRVYEMG